MMMGFAGQLSLGHALYVGLGAYAAAALYVHFGVGPWAGVFAGDRCCAAPRRGRSAGSRFRFGIAGVYFALLTIAFAEFTRIGFDTSTGPAAPAACSSGRAARSSTCCNLRGGPAMFYYVDACADGRRAGAVPRGCCARARLLLAGDPRGRGGGARARHRRVPLQDDRGA